MTSKIVQGNITFVKTGVEASKSILMLVLIMVIVSAAQIDNCQYYKIDSSNVQRCTICQQDYYLNVNYTRCSNCKSIDILCVRCDRLESQGKLFCQQCVSGFQIKNQKCQSIQGCNDKNCQYCNETSTNICYYCNQGYFLSTKNGLCSKCPNIDEFDAGNNTCACDSGFYLAKLNLSTNACKPCKYPCQQCSVSALNCSLCIYGYFKVSTNSCQLCLVPNCIICKDKNICLNCTLGYLLVDNQCQIQLQQQNIKQYINLPQFYYFCQPGCFYCYKYDFCLTCLEGYSRNLYNDVCQQCPSGCQRCQSLYNMQCYRCYSGFRLSNYSCIQCIDSNCLNCSSSEHFCLTCAIGFTSINGSCRPCASNCLNCIELGEGTCDTNKCYNGYARISSKECVLCALGCYSCSSVDISTCISCPQGSFQVLGGQCEICPPSCIECSSSSMCQICRQGYRLINNLCYQDCKYPCLECSPFNTNICSQCYLGYELTSDMTCLPDVSCNRFMNCTICPVGYFLNIFDFSCSQCSLQPNCIKCQTQRNKCAICDLGYYLIQNNCHKCNSACLICQLQYLCFQCATGYYLFKQNINQVYGNCLSCSANCKTCIDQPDKCNSCDSSMKLIGFSCITSQNIIFAITMQHQTITASNAQQLAFIKEIVPFTRALAALFGPPFSSNPQLLYLKDISSGSIQVTYMASTGNMDPRMLLNSITTALNKFDGFNDFTILTTQIITNGFQDDTVLQPPSTYLIVSLVPAPLFFIFMFAAIWNYITVKINSLTVGDQQVKGAQVNLQPADTEKNLKGQLGIGAITL